jgi:Arc/MetJ-type ribon-helix-helix transcriptional regulator
MTKKVPGVGLKRRRPNARYRKLAISMPAALIEDVEREIGAKRAPSVSAYVSEAVEEKLERDLLQEALDEVWSAKPMTSRERAWADKVLKV